jgi:hypothetical protein
MGHYVSIYLKATRARAQLETRSLTFFHDDKPAEDAWTPSQVVEFMMKDYGHGRFYILCPDNDLKMACAMVGKRESSSILISPYVNFFMPLFHLL